MKALVISVIIAVTSVVNVVSANNLKGFAYNSEMNQERVETKTVFKVEEDKYLHNHLKYNYTYDATGRILQKEVLKWNEVTETFEKHHCLNFSYTDNVMIEYAAWNEKENSYSNIKAKSVYQIDNGILYYSIYEWNQKESNWKLKMEHDATDGSNTLLANN